MPTMTCQKNGKPGYKYGEHGTCYTGSGGKRKALKQAVAIHASGFREMKHSKVKKVK